MDGMKKRLLLEEDEKKRLLVLNNAQSKQIRDQENQMNDEIKKLMKKD